MNKFLFLSLDRVLSGLQVTAAREGLFGFAPVPKKIRMSRGTLDTFLPGTLDSIELCKRTFVIQNVLFEVDNLIPYGKVFVRWGKPE